MKKFIFVLICILLYPFSFIEGVSYLKVRSNQHPRFLRIVVEAEEALVSRGTVNQRGNDIIVRFPHADLVVHKQRIMVPYVVDKHMIIFTPKPFSGFKVFTLQYPSRLVIDVYQRQQQITRGKRPVDAIRDRWREKSWPSVRSDRLSAIVKKHDKKEVKRVVIDPGHGGYETGIVEGDDKEKQVVLGIARELSSLVNRGSKKGLLTRESDQFLSLRERALFANGRKTDVFLSLHIGNHGNILLYTPVITKEVPRDRKDFMVNKGQDAFLAETAALRRAMESAFRENFGDDMVSSRPLPYSILSDIEAAALLIELPSFADAYYIAELKTELAQTIYRGITLYEEKTAN